jgi:predicted AAA+ superfamily ATPase
MSDDAIKIIEISGPRASGKTRTANWLRMTLLIEGGEVVIFEETKPNRKGKHRPDRLAKFFKTERPKTAIFVFEKQG